MHSNSTAIHKLQHECLDEMALWGNRTMLGLPACVRDGSDGTRHPAQRGGQPIYPFNSSFFALTMPASFKIRGFAPRLRRDAAG